MECPKCGGKTQAENTRQRPDGTVRRYHTCGDCGHHFRTAEINIDTEGSALKIADLNMDLVARLAAYHDAMRVCIKQLTEAAEIQNIMED